jgi:hypothetical protein
MTTPRQGRRDWPALESLAAVRTAEAGTTIEAVEESIAGIRAGRTAGELHRAAVLAAIDIGGPPPSDEGLREFAHSLGYVLDIDVAPAESRVQRAGR